MAGAAGVALAASAGLAAFPPTSNLLVGRAAAATADPVMVVAGDIACGPDDPSWNNGAGTATACQAEATAAETRQMAPTYLAPLGDTQYDYDAAQGKIPPLSYYQASYDASWGSLTTTTGGPVPNANIHPIPGNHEYGDITEAGPPLGNASTYFQNFGPTGLNELPAGVTGPGSDWYSYNVPVNGGTWHVVALDSECGAIGGCGTGSPEETWLRSDLGANASRCTIVYWHQPRWSEGPVGSASVYQAFWADAVAARVTAVLGGHEHNYQHFGPMGANGNPLTGGVSEFVVGTGGVNREATSNGAVAALVSSDSNDFGVLKLTLHATGFDYAFDTVGATTPDSGTVACTTPTGPVPTVSTVSPAYGPGAGATPVTITGSGFSAGDTVSFGATPATNVTVVSPSTITATAPAGANTVDVVVVAPGGRSTPVVGDEFTYTSSLNGYAVGLAASSTSVAAGSQVILTATANQDVGPTPYGMSIVDASTGVVLVHAGSGTTLTTTVSQPGALTRRYVAQIDSHGGPPIEAVSVPVVVTWGCGTACKGPVAAVSAVSPISGPASGGTTVTISGAGFSPGNTVTFGPSPGANVKVVSASTITATAPPGSGTVDVQVINPGGASAVVVGDEFTYTQALNGYSVSLSSTSVNPAVGGSVTLTATANQDVGPTPYGLSIVDASTNTVLVHVGSGTSVAFTVIQTSATTHRYVGQIDSHGGPPIEAESAPVVVTWGCTSLSCGPAPLAVSAVSPTYGPAAGGTPVTITGTAFSAGDTVSFGGTPATNVKVVSSTSITATAPAGANTVDVIVAGTGGTSAPVVGDEYTYTSSLNGYAVTLAASSISQPVGGSVTLTATANQDVGPTPYGMSIVDASTNTVLIHVGSGVTVSFPVSQSSATTHRYVGQIDSHGGPPIEAVSAPVIVTWS